MIVTSGLTARTASKFSPVNGHCIDDTVGVYLTRSVSGATRQYAEGQSGRACGICRRKTGVRVLLQRDGPRPTFLYGIAEAMQQSQTRIACPGENQFPRAAHSNHLIENDVGSHSNKRQIAALLPDELVPGGKWNQMAEAFQRHGIAIMNKFNNCFF